MKYRHFGKLSWEASVLGFGAMRLPILGGDFGKINEPEATKMIRFAIDHGVNYVDTAYAYHNKTSETFLAKALQDGYRERIKLATKMPTWLIKSQADMDKYLGEQLERLNTEHIDFYLLHGLGKERWGNLASLNVLDWAERQMDEQKFRHFGFSFHDDYETFKSIVDAFNGWTMCQVLYNYMDENHEAGRRGIKYAASKGLAVVVMEPLAGGRLALEPHEKIKSIWNEAEVKREPAEWGLQWVWDQPEVSLALSGMNTLKQVEDNVRYANRAACGILTVAELGLIRRVAQQYRQVGFIQCTQCRYCQPCPSNVNIPAIIAHYNEFFMKDRDPKVKEQYLEAVPKENRAKNCTRCGECEELCPQHLAIRRTVSQVGFMFEQD